MRCGRLANGKVAHTRLNPGGARYGVKANNAIKTGSGKDKTSAVRGRPSRKARSSPSRHNRNIACMADGKHLTGLLLGVRQNHNGG